MSKAIITEEVWEGAAGKKVPLVIYTNGQRKVVGDAFIHTDGRIDAKLDEEVELPEALKAGFVISASLGPLPNEAPDLTLF